MKKNHFELKNYVMATGVFILAVIAGILIFFRVCAEGCTGEFSEYIEDKCAETKRTFADDTGY